MVRTSKNCGKVRKKRCLLLAKWLFHKDSNHSTIQIAHYIIPRNLQAIVQQATLQSTTKQQKAFGSKHDLLLEKKTSARFPEVQLIYHMYMYIYIYAHKIGYHRTTIELSQASFCCKKSISVTQILWWFWSPILGGIKKSCIQRVITGSWLWRLDRCPLYTMRASLLLPWQHRSCQINHYTFHMPSNCIPRCIKYTVRCFGVLPCRPHEAFAGRDNADRAHSLRFTGLKLNGKI